MKKALFIVIISLITLSACKKEEETPLCEQYEYGTIVLDNKREYTYDLYIDSEYVREIGPNEVVRINKSVGHHYVKLEMGLSYYYYKTVYVGMCDDVLLVHEY